MIGASLSLVGSTLRFVNTTNQMTTYALKVYTIDKMAVVGIVAGVFGGLPALIILCCCINACTSKPKPVTTSKVDLPKEAISPKNILLQKFCEVKDKTLAHLKISETPEEVNEKLKKRRLTFFAKRASTVPTPVTSFSDSAEENPTNQKNKKKSKKKKSKKDAADEQPKKKKSKKSKKSVKMAKTTPAVFEEFDEVGVERVAVETRTAAKKKKRRRMIKDSAV